MTRPDPAAPLARFRLVIPQETPVQAAATLARRAARSTGLDRTAEAALVALAGDVAADGTHAVALTVPEDDASTLEVALSPTAGNSWLRTWSALTGGTVREGKAALALALPTPFDGSRADEPPRAEAPSADDARHLLGELRAREHELARVASELNETNTGVLALYDELETLHRVGMMLAERHHLHDLLQTIIDATTELTGAELGAFYHHERTGARWRMNAISGPHRHVLLHFPPELETGFFDGLDEAPEVQRIDDVDATPASAPCAAWIAMVAPLHPLRSVLFVPVLMSDAGLAGALVFGHSGRGAFSERSERIVAAIAVQAAIGIEKARLFHGLQTASEAKDRFLAMLSHELRTPLNPVATILSTLAEDAALPAHLREDVAVMQRNIELEARLIDDLLDFNRIIRGKFELNRSPVDVHDLIRSVAGICQTDVTAHHHTLELALAAPRSVVAGDAARLQQILWNLLHNAVKFTPEGGRIAITTRAEDASLVVETADTGCGIDPQDIAGIFSAFDQGKLQPGRFGGLGLGLAIAKTFAEGHGGEIRAASEGTGHGARFTLRLPLLVQAPEPAPRAVAPAPPVGSSAACRILLVEDHADTLQALARLLRRRGHSVLTASTCAQAERVAAGEEFDLIATDLGLPDGSGYDLLRRLRRHSQAPAIALSGYGMEADVARSQEAGFQRHLTKPIAFSELEKAIASLCG